MANTSAAEKSIKSSLLPLASISKTFALTEPWCLKTKGIDHRNLGVVPGMKRMMSPLTLLNEFPSEHWNR